MIWASVMILCATSAASEGHVPDLFTTEDWSFLETITSAVVEASRVAPETKVASTALNNTGGTLIRPGGRDCYPAFWIRDYAMSLDTELFTPAEERHALFLTARHQQDEPITLKSGSRVPQGAIADHITFDSKAIFFPGTLDDAIGQGGPQWGELPPYDDAFYFIHMAWHYAHITNDFGFLTEKVNGLPLSNRLEQAFHMPPSRKETELVYAEPGERGIKFGFVDSITHTGDLLFASLLKWQAATELAWIFSKENNHPKVHEYEQIARKLKKAIPKCFATEHGWLRASTGVSGQPDVWGTAFAVYLGLLPKTTEQAACRTIAEAYHQGTITWQGNIRHVPTTDDFSATSAWEKALPAKNRYQNGAYWGTPTGWVCFAIAKVDPKAARKLANEYLAELRAGDFRKGSEFGSPWECMHQDGDHRQNPVYMASVTCPLTAFKRLAGR